MRNGLLFIGDVHLASRIPGFRRDDYPETMLGKLEWAFDYAHEHALEPVLLGDLFHWPRDNANWLVGRLLDLLPQGTWAVAGNHDCSHTRLMNDDSLSLLVKAGSIRLLTSQTGWDGELEGIPVSVRGSSWGEDLPESIESTGATIWVTHHDVAFPDTIASNPVEPREIPGVDLVVNGHLHGRVPDQQCGDTQWINPGSLCRISRSQTTQAHRPSVLVVGMADKSLSTQLVEVPHRPFDEVFYINDQPIPAASHSHFVQGLAQLQQRRTQTGAGLDEFLEVNLKQVDPEIRDAILELAHTVRNP